jgi:flagella basal body P-ring formation protein FlgA
MMSMTKTFNRLGPVLILALFCSAESAVATPPDFDTRLTNVIEKAIAQHTGFATDQLEISRHARRFPERCAKAQALHVRVSAHDDGVGPTTVRVTVTDAQGVIGSFPVPIRVRVFDSVLVTRDRIPRQKAISAGDLNMQRREITKYIGHTMADLDKVVGQWATRTINAGQIVDQRWLAPVPLVMRGDRIKMVFSSGVVAVSTVATAMENGYKDQEIKVKSPHGNRLVSAVVIDEYTVRPSGRR